MCVWVCVVCVCVGVCVCVCVCVGVCVCVWCVCVCGVTECPLTTFSEQQGGREDLQSSAQRSSLQAPRIRSLINSAYLRDSCDSKSFWPVVFLLCVCFMLNLVTVSTLRGNRVHCEQSLHLLETHQLYSRLISCTRKISTLHLEFKCVHPIRGESSGVPIV